jgi:NAD(P)-dependent dehydrogenase (short-subunit alcohol dehydrogenase family)
VGATVFASARRPESLAELVELGIRPLRLDVRDEAQVVTAVDAAGSIDVLVANAGCGVRGAIEEVADRDLGEVFDTNVFGVWRCCRAVLPQMRRRGSGTIIVVSSYGGQVPFPGLGAYRSSKFALEGLVWTLHLEVAHFGIRVVDIQPGSVATDFRTRSVKQGSRSLDGDPYGGMRTIATEAYRRMSPSAVSAEHVAAVIVDEARRDRGPLRVRIGEDAKRMTTVVQAGDEQYERFLVGTLGFRWHPLPADT